MGDGLRKYWVAELQVVQVVREAHRVQCGTVHKMQALEILVGLGLRK